MFKDFHFQRCFDSPEWYCSRVHFSVAFLWLNLPSSWLSYHQIGFLFPRDIHIIKFALKLVVKLNCYISSIASWCMDFNCCWRIIAWNWMKFHEFMAGFSRKLITRIRTTDELAWFDLVIALIDLMLGFNVLWIMIAWN